MASFSTSRYNRNTGKYSFNTAQYLKSRNKSYETNLSGSLINGVKYSNLNDDCCANPIPYSNTPTYERDPSKLGSQVRKSLSQEYEYRKV